MGITKEEAHQFVARWQLVNSVVLEEMRHTPVSVKLKQLALLFEAGRTLGWADKSSKETDEVRERWRCLKAKHHV